MSLFQFEDSDVWHPVGETTLYRLVPADAEYDPASEWPGDGRFDLPGVPTLYMSRSPEGAAAEYFRRHPELLNFKGRLKLRLFLIRFNGLHDGADVHDERRAANVGVDIARLRSSDLRRRDRHKECRELAVAVDQRSGVSIEYPSAAYDGVSNVVALRSQGPWTARSDGELELPELEPDRLRPLPLGAEP